MKLASTSTTSVTEIVYKLENEIKNMIKFGKSQEEIKNRAIFAYGTILGAPETERLVAEKVANYGDFNLIQQIMRSKIIQEINGRDNYILDPKSRQVVQISKERLREVLHPKMDISEKLHTCRFDYNPFVMSQLYQNSHGDWIYNQYEPPAWQADCFFSGGKVAVNKRDEIPELYHKFIMHLVDNDEKSYKYILDWMANALQHRNYCILTTIGEEGVGKGRLGEILKVMFGKNFSETGKRILTERFNNQIKNKRIIYCDEASVRNEEQEERLKVLVNNAVEVEAKGKDAEQVTNYASIYFSSNSLDAIRLNSKDRRYSIVNLTKTQLKDVWTVEQIGSLTDEENVKQLAEYLFYRPINRQEMMNVFKSEHTETIRSHSLTAWNDWLLDEYAKEKAGQIIKVDVVSEAIEDKFGSKYRPSKTAFIKLEQQYPKVLHVYKPTIDGKQVWAIKFADKE